MDESLYTQQLKAAMNESQQGDAEILLKAHAKQFPDASSKVLCEKLSEGTELVKWMNRVVNNLPAEFMSVKKAFVAELVRRQQWDNLCNLLNLTLSAFVLNHFQEDKAGLTLFLKDLCHRWRIAEIKKILADSIGHDLFPEVVCILADPDSYLSADYFDVGTHVYSHVYIRIVHSFHQPRLERAYDCLCTDDRYPCQYLRILLAARMRKWRQVTVALKSGSVVLLKGSDDVFVHAMQCRAWSCAAYVLNAVMQEKDVSETEYLLDLQYRAEVRLLGKLRYRAILIPFVQQCRRLKLHAAGALFAAWDRKWRTVENLLGHLQQGTGDNANLVLMEELLKNRKFRPVYNWLQRPTQHDLWPKYVDSILWETIVNCKNPEANALAGQLMGQCEDGSLLGQVLYHIIIYCQDNLLHRFLAKDLLPRTEDLEFALHCAVDMLGVTVLQGRADQKLARYQVLLKCLEAGCFIQLSPTARMPLDGAVRHGLVHVLQLFYQTGAFTNSVFHAVHVELQSGTGNGNPTRKAAKVRRLFQQITEVPRSLQSLCCITVSRLLGSGADRKERALGLGLPVTLTREVLFLDILYADSDTSPFIHEENSVW